jgi:hypothetical protein
MGVYIESMVEGLTKLVRTIGEDGKMRRWFIGLADKSVEERRNTIYSMTAKMASVTKDESLVTALKLLAIPAVFEAACAMLREMS